MQKREQCSVFAWVGCGGPGSKSGQARRDAGRFYNLTDQTVLSLRLLEVPYGRGKVAVLTRVIISLILHSLL